MAKDQKDMLIAWLNDAYAMENALVKTLDNHANDAKDHPQIQAKIQEHLDQTRGHADLVKSCINRLGGSTSALKSGMATVTGMMQNLPSGGAEDELVKNAISDYAAENFEIASYNALIVAAQDYGDMETVQVCQRILRDEQDMAQWLNQNLPVVVLEIFRSKATTRS